MKKIDKIFKEEYMANYNYPNPQRARKKVKGLKIYTGIITVLLVALLAVGITMICTGYMQFGSTEETETETDDVSTVVEQEEDEGVTLVASGISRASYELYSVSYEAESAYTITATITPSDAIDTLTWTVGFADENSEWATGETVTDYVDIAVSDDTMSATVACYAAFGEQIVITATADYSGAYGSTTVDYVKKIASADLALYLDGVETDVITFSDTELTYTITLKDITYGTGTLTPETELTITSFTLYASSYYSFNTLNSEDNTFTASTPYDTVGCDNDTYYSIDATSTISVYLSASVSGVYGGVTYQTLNVSKSDLSVDASSLYATAASVNLSGSLIFGENTITE